MTADHATLHRESLLAHARDVIASHEESLLVLADVRKAEPADETLLAAYEQTLRVGVSFARLVIATLEGK